MKKWLFIISVAFNLVFLAGWGLSAFNSPSYKTGKLSRDVSVGYFGGDSVIFRLPKGLTVRNISERGISAIDQFENCRFEIVITSDNDQLVNYNLPEDSLNVFGNYYSADVN